MLENLLFISLIINAILIGFNSWLNKRYGEELAECNNNWATLLKEQNTDWAQFCDNLIEYLTTSDNPEDAENEE